MCSKVSLNSFLSVASYHSSGNVTKHQVLFELPKELALGVELNLPFQTQIRLY